MSELLTKTELASINAAIAYMPILALESWDANAYIHRTGRRDAFTDGARWQRAQILPDLKFIFEALPNEHRITDLQLRAELDLVRNKLNEIIAKIQ